jgi:hypothetical protein
MGHIHVSAQRSNMFLFPGIATTRNQVDELGLGAPFG